MRLEKISGFLSPESPREILERLGVLQGTPGLLAASLPFSAGDATAGSETELQAVVAGEKDAVDLPITIEQSNYFSNILRRAAAGEAPKRLITDLERFLNNNTDNVWENSWVRFPRRLLSPFAERVLTRDLLADKNDPQSGQRRDSHRFIFSGADGEELLRLPISYLIKLSLAHLIGSQEGLPEIVHKTGERLMGHYLNDNTSPETFSFHVTLLHPHTGMGRAVAKETSKRYLLAQLLVMYANESFKLKERGQQAMIYFAPHPPIRQKELNSHIPDAFYRELFMSPCLSGWDKGEAKYRYMHLCHQVLSRSQLNAVAKLKEAGIIINNLVVLPNVSNVSLANNGVHISLGSRMLSRAAAGGDKGFTAAHEKHLGDLTIKMAEHFLPLFVGSYSAAPYRLGYTDFHPERALGFLAHELDFTHLRMIWRRWQKKARLSLFGAPITPFGPKWLDRMVSSLCGLSGDFVPDFRLIDYLVCLLSTESSPALNGVPGNSERLKQDLADMGVFDGQMSLYLLYKLREFGNMGFSGFEGRHYSLFENLEDDMGGAADLQTLVTALAFKYMANGEISHSHIPDDPSVESERRQIFFGAAIGVPTFFVHTETRNLFMRKIIARTREVRQSSRYPGYLRVHNRQYQKALLQILLEDGADLIEAMDMRGTMEELAIRLEHPEKYATAGRLTRGVLDEMNASSPMGLDANEFNRGAERYYRGTLRRRHIQESLGFLEEDFIRLDRERGEFDPQFAAALSHALQGEGASAFLRRCKRDILEESASSDTLRKLMNLLLLTIRQDALQAETTLKETKENANGAASVHRAGHG